MSTPPVRRALLRDLTAAINAWAREHHQRDVTAHVPKGIAAREAAARRAVRELETDARLMIANRAERAATLRALATVRRSIHRGLADRHREYDRPAHRASDRAFRDAVRKVAADHHVDISTVARIIVTRIAPALPEPHRTALLGPWGSIEEQRKHLTDRLRRAR